MTEDSANRIVLNPEMDSMSSAPVFAQSFKEYEPEYLSMLKVPARKQFRNNRQKYKTSRY